MNGLIQSLRGLGTFRLMALAAVAAASIGFFYYISSQIGTPGMSLLYSDLTVRDSNQIIAKLEAANVPYKLRAGGTQILVPSDKALRMRMTLAQEGLPRGGSVGYEIFDRSESMGSSSFVQNINKLRALEGELSRTITSLAQVRAARVHVVLPKRQLFARQRAKPSASIIVKTYRGEPLSASQVLAIQHLVAAGVPGLKPSRISIVDQRGNLLARGTNDASAPNVVARTADEMRRGYESRIARKIETILGRSLGAGKVRAQVTAEMDFDRITTATEKYDPDSRVVRSTQTIQEKTNEKNTTGAKAVTAGTNLRRAGGKKTETAEGRSRSLVKTQERVNYEISKTVQNHVRVTGVIKRLSVAVLVDGTYKGVGEKAAYTPRTKADLERLTALVRSAIGYNQKRGDSVEVINMRFADGAPKPEIKAEAPMMGLGKNDFLRIGEIVVLAILGILVLMMVIRPLVRKVVEYTPPEEDATPQLTDQSAAALPSPEVDEAMMDLEQVDGRVKASSIKKIGDIVEKHPEETVQIIRNWMYQEG